MYINEWPKLILICESIKKCDRFHKTMFFIISLNSNTMIQELFTSRYFSFVCFYVFCRDREDVFSACGWVLMGYLLAAKYVSWKSDINRNFLFSIITLYSNLSKPIHRVKHNNYCSLSHTLSDDLKRNRSESLNKYKDDLYRQGQVQVLWGESKLEMFALFFSSV